MKKAKRRTSSAGRSAAQRRFRRSRRHFGTGRFDPKPNLCEGLQYCLTHFINQDLTTIWFDN